MRRRSVVWWLPLLVLLVLLTGCFSIAPMRGQNDNLPEAIKAVKAQGGTGCFWLRLTGSYPPFGNGSVVMIESYDTTDGVASKTAEAAKQAADAEKRRLNFKDCASAIPEQYRALIVPAPPPM